MVSKTQFVHGIIGTRYDLRDTIFFRLAHYRIDLCVSESGERGESDFFSSFNLYSAMMMNVIKH